MRSKWSVGGRRAAGLVCLAFAVAVMAAGCGNDGGAGDGATDNGDTPLPGGATGVAGKANGSAGAASSLGGTGGSTAGGAGTSGVSGAAGLSGGSSGNTGVSGSSGSVGSAGHAGSAASGGANGGNGGTTGTSGSTSTGGSAGTSGSTSTGGTSTGGTSTGGTSGAGTAGGSGGTSGGATCVSNTCGNSTTEGCETCDDGPAFVGGSAGGSGGGSGTINPNYGTLCSGDCNYKVSTPDCLSCELANDCVISAQNCTFPLDAMANPTTFTPQQSALCFSVMHCIQASNCFDGSNTIGACYCGTLNTTACGAAPFDLKQPGAPNGPCAAVIQAGMTGLTSNSAIIGGLFATAKPAGAAMQRLNCQKTDVGNACQDVCGFKSGGPAFP